METGINYKGVDLWVKFNVIGVYFPATQYEPAEEPEIEITGILVEDTDISDLLSDEQIDEIYKLLEEKL